MRIAAYVPDLIDRSKVAAAAPDATFVDKPSKLAGLDAALVVVDLGRPGVIDELGSLSGRVIGFARHTQRDLIAEARAAGCDEVLVRSDFFPRLGELLAEDPQA
ncbi:MAG: hypothetical protein QOD63_2263 [Actinomycetota bacterium]|nr:hypothetical protein [Actinomycetota bacterium]